MAIGEYLRMPAKKVEDGTPSDFPSMGSPIAAPEIALWTTSEYSWQHRPTVFSNLLPIAWTLESLQRTVEQPPFDDPGLYKTTVTVVYEPGTPYGTQYSVMRRPRVVLLRDMTGIGSFDTAILESLGPYIASELGGQLDQHSIAVYAVPNSSSYFIPFGFPATTAKRIEVNPSAGAQAAGTFESDPDAFLGGDVLCISCMTVNEYSYIDDGPTAVLWQEHVDSDIAVVMGALDSFSRFHHSVYMIFDSAEDGGSGFFSQVYDNWREIASQLAAQGTPHTVTEFGVPVGSDIFEVTKAKVVSDIKSFFGLI